MNKEWKGIDHNTTIYYTNRSYNGIDDILKDLEKDFGNLWTKFEPKSEKEIERLKKVKFRENRLNKIINRTNKSKSKGNG